MNKVASRQDLIADIRASLGEPIIRVEVTDEHINKAIDLSLKEFWKYHRDGSMENYYAYLVQPEDVQSNTIPIPGYISNVIEVLPGGIGVNAVRFGNPEWHIMHNTMQSVNSPGSSVYGGVNPGGTVNGYQTVGQFSSMNLSDWLIAKNYMNTVRYMTGSNIKSFKFNRFLGKVFPFFTFGVGDIICMRVYENIDPDSRPECVAAWDDEWLKSLATAYTKVTWGSILRKYQSVQLPGGVTVDGQTLVSEGNAEVDELLAAVRDESPIPFFIA